MNFTSPPETSAQGSDVLDVVPLRHPGRWIGGAGVLFLAVLIGYSVATNERFAWDVVAEYFFSSTILHGVWATIWLTAISMSLAIILALVLALMRLSANPVLRAGAGAYVWFFRGTPLLVQLLFLYNISALYPNFSVLGFDIDLNQIMTKVVVAVLALALNEAAYAAEIVRAGLASVEYGQTEAAQALGLRRGQTMRRIILPQAMRVIVPPLGNDTIAMLKYTSLVSVIAMPELLYAAQIIYSRTFETIPLLLVASIWYLTLTTILSIGQSLLERRFSRQRQQPPSILRNMLSSIARPRKIFRPTSDAASSAPGES